MSWLDHIFGITSVENAGTQLPTEPSINFTGTGVTAVDNPSLSRTDVTITAGGAGISTLTGDVSASGVGSVAATVQGIRGHTVASTTPTDAQTYLFDGSTWNPKTISGDATITHNGVLTVLGAKATGIVTLEQYGAVGDGVTSDQTAYAAALAALNAASSIGTGPHTIQLGANRTYLVTGGSLTRAGTSVVGFGDSSVLKTATNATVLLLIGSECSASNFKVLGNATGTSQIGIANSDIVSGLQGSQKCRVTNVTFDSLGGAGLMFYNALETLFTQGPSASGIKAYNCPQYGLWLDQQYSTVIDIHVEGCGEGVRHQAANVCVMGGTVTDCTIGYHLVGGAGGNDGHGITQLEINHNTTNLLIDNNLTTGHIFDGCHFYGTGTNINFAWSGFNTNSVFAIHFDGCHVDVDDYYFEGSQNIRFNNCIFPSNFNNTIHNNYNGHASTTYWNNPVDLNGQVPAFLAFTTTGASWPSEISTATLAFTFGSDADATLTAAQSRCNSIIIAAGVVSTTRTITLTHPSDAGFQIDVTNNNTQSIAVKLTSGTGITIPPGGHVLLGCDGTNLIQRSVMAAQNSHGMATFGNVGSDHLAALGPDVAAETAASCLWLLANGVAPSASNYALQSDGNDLIVAASGSGASIYFFNNSGQSGRVDAAGWEFNLNVKLDNVSTPSTPSGGPVLFGSSGAAKVIGTSGTITTFGPAEPHCDQCGSDFMTEHESPKYGYLAVCLKCMADEFGDRKWIKRSKP